MPSTSRGWLRLLRTRQYPTASNRVLMRRRNDHGGCPTGVRARATPIRRYLHAKIIFLHIGDEMLSAVGSLNDGENSRKVNCEVLLLMDHPQVYA
jgi:hypothetical protein